MLLATKKNTLGKVITLASKGMMWAGMRISLAGKVMPWVEREMTLASKRMPLVGQGIPWDGKGITWAGKVLEVQMKWISFGNDSTYNDFLVVNTK
ncbi:hypothetical protein DPMN_168634 [Dreissena polymorpha]|uniref:Uncharacterized protein n=1 Tax=Dreissena polymorpha TaxID=45954 RepID=A0A9D4F116_DREPO|nr:hypothetical protein DPMN_168634 [Dreissena polymorpha]